MAIPKLSLALPSLQQLNTGGLFPSLSQKTTTSGSTTPTSTVRSITSPPTQQTSQTSISPPNAPPKFAFYSNQPPLSQRVSTPTKTQTQQSYDPLPGQPGYHTLSGTSSPGTSLGYKPPPPTASSQLADVGRLRAEQQATQASKQAELETAQSQLEALYGKLETINRATDMGLTPGSTYQQAIQFMEGGNQNPMIPEEDGEPDTNVDNIEKQIAALNEALYGSAGTLAGLNEQETATNEHLQNIMQSRDLGIEQVREQPIATPFITGQSAAIQRQSAIQAQPLINQLINIQQKRMFEKELGMGRIQAAESLLSRADKKAKENREATQMTQTARALSASISQNPSLFFEMSDEQQAMAVKELTKVGFDFSRIKNPEKQIETWGDYYTLPTGDLAQKNDVTGEINVISQANSGRAGAANGLTPYQTQNSLNAVMDDARQDPAIKSFPMASAGWAFMNTLSSTTKNPADNIGMIYAFAKIMDPESVVREGEYATVQKYAQTWSQTFGINVQRILDNKAFLTQQAMTNMKKTAQSRYGAFKTQYEQAQKTYQNRLDAINRGELYGELPDYSYQDGGQTGGSTFQSPTSGATYNLPY